MQQLRILAASLVRPRRSPRRRSGRVTPTVLGAVLLAALTAVGGLPVAGSVAAAGIASTGGGGAS